MHIEDWTGAPAQRGPGRGLIVSLWHRCPAGRHPSAQETPPMASRWRTTGALLVLVVLAAFVVRIPSALAEPASWFMTTTYMDGVALELKVMCDYEGRKTSLQVRNAGSANDVDVALSSLWGATTIADLDANEVETRTFNGSQPGSYVSARPSRPADASASRIRCPLDPSRSDPDAGYWMLSEISNVYPFGRAERFGPTGVSGARDIEPTPDAQGYWIVTQDGWVQAYGSARNFGNGGPLHYPESMTSISRTASGSGYWLFSSHGRVKPFGDALHFGDLMATPLNAPIVDSVTTPSGKGYYMVAADGGVFTFGDAVFRGSTGAMSLNAPVQSLVPDPDGVGYWLVAADGGVFAFDAAYRGSMGGKSLNRPVVGMVAYGDGYLMVAQDGGIFSFSDKAFYGSLGDDPSSREAIVAVAAFAPGS